MMHGDILMALGAVLAWGIFLAGLFGTRDA